LDAGSELGDRCRQMAIDRHFPSLPHRLESRQGQAESTAERPVARFACRQCGQALPVPSERELNPPPKGRTRQIFIFFTMS